MSERERGGGTERSHLQLCLKTLTVAPESLAPVTIEAWFNSLLTIRVPCNMRQFKNTLSPSSVTLHLSHECRNVHGVGGKPHAKHQGSRLPNKASNLSFQLLMYAKSACKKCVCTFYRVEITSFLLPTQLIGWTAGSSSILQCRLVGRISTRSSALSKTKIVVGPQVQAPCCGASVSTYAAQCNRVK